MTRLECTTDDIAEVADANELVGILDEQQQVKRLAVGVPLSHPLQPFGDGIVFKEAGMAQRFPGLQIVMVVQQIRANAGGMGYRRRYQA
ncbi:hypothetical protein G6F23_014539 [Rhizopus arrhizus]|nr:hypothetical protein G6F23_014539 [Rhizopus arrhizus]